MKQEFQIAKVSYSYEVQGKTAKVVREDGAVAELHDDENIISDWETTLMESIVDGCLHFFGGGAGV